jgi:hypothetical protein
MSACVVEHRVDSDVHVNLIEFSKRNLFPTFGMLSQAIYIYIVYRTCDSH